MKIFSRITAAVIICSLCFIQCTKETTPDNSSGLPNATETGADIFASELMGVGVHVDIFNDTTVFTSYQEFIADNDLNNPNYPTSGNGAWLKNDTLTIAGDPQIGSFFQGIQFTITGNLQQGTIYNVDSTGIVAFASTDSTCQGIYPLSPTGSVADSGTIQLTKFDTLNKIVSGVFTCKFPFPQCDSTLYALQGRFDYKYH
jgi:hypothetical protein